MRDRRAHIKVSRRFFEEDSWWSEPRRFSKAEAWIDCIQLASWKPRRFAIGLEVEHLRRGEFMASLRFLGQRWRWSKSAVERFLAVLEKAGRIAGQRVGQGGTVYLLVNYDWYQGSERPSGTPDGTPSGTPAGHLRDKSEAGKAGKAVKASHREAIAEAAKMWAASRGEPPYARIGKAMKVLVPKHGMRQVLLVWAGYLEERRDKGFCTPEDFLGNYGFYRRKCGVEIVEDGTEIPVPDEPEVAA